MAFNSVQNVIIDLFSSRPVCIEGGIRKHKWYEKALEVNALVSCAVPCLEFALLKIFQLKWC
jgi:ABC-type antimicrobial peptide transport system permease subunit